MEVYSSEEENGEKFSFYFDYKGTGFIEDINQIVLRRYKKNISRK